MATHVASSTPNGTSSQERRPGVICGMRRTSRNNGGTWETRGAYRICSSRVNADAGRASARACGGVRGADLGVGLRLPQAAYKVVGELLGDLFRRRGPVRVVPARNPVHGAEDGEGEELRIGVDERARANPFLQHLAHPFVEPIAPDDH